MEPVSQPKSEALQALFWRDEILQVMFWIKGEGFGDEVDPGLIERLLGVEASVGMRYLDRLVDERLLQHSSEGSYGLTPDGERFGARIFAEEFAELTRPSHGECGDDCWCRSSPEEAEACAVERLSTGSREH